MAKKKNVGGRPRKAASERYLNPARQIGRMPDEAWETLVRAAELEGKATVGAWAQPVLLAAAKRVIRKHGGE